MTEISILAIDLAKHNFQVCATTSEGEVIYNRKYTRGRLAKLLALQCVGAGSVPAEFCSPHGSPGNAVAGPVEAAERTAETADIGQ